MDKLGTNKVTWTLRLLPEEDKTVAAIKENLKLRSKNDVIKYLVNNYVLDKVE